jgi:hypothetical protein
MKPLVLVVMALAAFVAVAPTASAYPAPVASGHYTGEADDYSGNRKPVEFDVSYHDKLVKNFRFGDLHFGPTAMTIHHISGLPESWLFAATHNAAHASYRWNGGWNGPTQTSGQVTETVHDTGARHVFQYRAYKR